MNLDACCRGDKTAWDAFVDRHMHCINIAVYQTLSVRGVKEEAFIQDTVQEIFLRLIKDDYRLLKSYDPTKASLSTWLGIIARSKAIDRLRQKGRQPQIRSLEEAPIPEILPEPETETISIPKGLLTSRQMLILQLIYDKEMEVAEVATRLKITAQTVRSAKHKALTRLRSHFQVER